MSSVGFAYSWLYVGFVLVGYSSPVTNHGDIHPRRFLLLLCEKGNPQHEYTCSNGVPLERPAVSPLKESLWSVPRVWWIWPEWYFHKEVQGTRAINVKDCLTATTIGFRLTMKCRNKAIDPVVGYAHCGMVVATRWTANQAIPFLSRAVGQFLDYKIR